MGLRAEFQDLATEVFDEFDDVPLAATLTRPARPSRDAADAQTDAAAQYQTRCVLSMADRTDPVTGLLRSYDATALIPAVELAVAPLPEDRLQVDGVTWAIADEGVTIDEAGAVHTCRLRRMGI